MGNLAQVGRILLLAAGVLALVGLGLLLASRVAWSGRFPGDIEFEIGNASCVFSLGLSLALSVGLTLILNLLARLLRR